MKNISAKTKGIIAGGLFFTYVLVCLINAIKAYSDITYYYHSFFSAYGASILVWLLLAFLAVSLIVDKPKLATVSRILAVVLSAFSLVLTFVTLGRTANSFVVILNTLLSLLASVMLLLAFVRLGKQGQVFCFIALGASVLPNVIRCIAFRGSLLSTVFSPAQLLFYAALAVTAFYVADKFPEANVQPQAEPRAETSNKLEKLSALKELYDKGIITQEEFDEKKKQLLGL